MSLSDYLRFNRSLLFEGMMALAGLVNMFNPNIYMNICGLYD